MLNTDEWKAHFLEINVPGWHCSFLPKPIQLLPEITAENRQEREENNEEKEMV